jgi:hypothetical protein
MKISPKQLKEGIIKEAKNKARKRELYEAVCKIEKELETINENSFIASFGFDSKNDTSNKTKTGFVNDFQSMGLSNVARLAQEMSDEESKENINEEKIDEITKLKEEIENLKKENEELKNK